MPSTSVVVTRDIGTGYSHRVTATVEAESQSVCDGVLLPAAKTGTLTTRTNAEDGVITLTTGHGFSSGTHDVYFDGGVRYGVTTTIVGDDCTIEDGAGDDLPADESAVTVALPVSESFTVPASSAKVISCYFPLGQGVVRLRSSVPAVLATYLAKTAVAQAKGWDSDSGGSNPLGSTAVATLLLSNGSTTAQTLQVVVPYTA